MAGRLHRVVQPWRFAVRRLLSIVPAFVVLACSGSVEPAVRVSEGEGPLTITISQPSYTWDEQIGPVVRGTVANATDHTLYAVIGDAFIGGPEQDPVLIAAGGDGTIERSVGATWAQVALPIAVEGVREVQLRPGKTYGFLTQPGTPKVTGTFRIGIGVRESSGGAIAARAYSGTFEIR
jgi:hypothetical protein